MNSVELNLSEKFSSETTTADHETNTDKAVIDENIEKGRT